MIQLIIGQNASGKTLYLDTIIEEKLKHADDINFVTNIGNNKYNELLFSKKRVKILDDILMDFCDSIDTSNELITPINSEIVFSTDFLYMVTLLCKNVDEIYLDEPEQGLIEFEIKLLTNFLELIDKTYNKIVIVTHSELLVQMPYFDAYTIKMSNITSQVELLPVKGEDVLEVID